MTHREAARQGLLLFGMIALFVALLVIGILVVSMEEEIFNLDILGNQEANQVVQVVNLTPTALPTSAAPTILTPATLPPTTSATEITPTLSSTPTLTLSPPPSILPTSTAATILTPSPPHPSTPTVMPVPTNTPPLPTPAPVTASAPPAFPLGLYDVPPDAFATVRQAGFDFVHIYDSGQSLANAIAYLELAQEADLLVMQNMPSGSLYEGDDFWIEWVSTLAAYDNLLWWYLPEEPTRFDDEVMRRIYSIIREYDPRGRPAVLYYGTTHLEGRCDLTDIILVQAYPEYNEAPRSDVRAWIDIARELCPGQPVISVQALFDNNFDGTGDRPTPAEARSDFYTAIIAGSTALPWYSYDQGQSVPELWSATQEAVKEIKTLIPVITAPPVAQTIQVQILFGPTLSPESEDHTYDSIQFLQKTYEGATYIFAVNLAEEPVTVQFGGLPAAAEVSVLFEERSLPLTNGIFIDEFSGAVAHVYKIEPN